MFVRSGWVVVVAIALFEGVNSNIGVDSIKKF